MFLQCYGNDEFFNEKLGGHGTSIYQVLWFGRGRNY